MLAAVVAEFCHGLTCIGAAAHYLEQVVERCCGAGFYDGQLDQGDWVGQAVHQRTAAAYCDGGHAYRAAVGNLRRVQGAVATCTKLPNTSPQNTLAGAGLV